MSNNNRIICPYHQSKYDRFHDICPLNGTEGCKQYMVVEKQLALVDRAYGEFQRDAYSREAYQKRIACPYNKSQYDAFHDICPKNGTSECERYQLLEQSLSDVDQAFGAYQRNAYRG